MAREKFEDRRLTGKINVACKFDDGSQRNWVADKIDVVSQIQEVVQSYEEMGYKLTLRQLHYQFVSRNWIVNHTTAYKKLGCILDDCRYAGVINWDSIEDRGRVPYIPYWVDGVNDALNDTIRHYRLDLQQEQKNHVEVWTEKDALSGIMKRSTSKYHVRLVVNKGYTSSSAIYAAYERFANHLSNGRNVTILYFGDHDPSGLDMVRDIKERLEFMFLNGNYAPGFNKNRFKVVAIGLTMSQIKKYKLPPNPAKTTDSRSAAYINEFGTQSWEVDALSPEVLTQIVEDNIEHSIDMDLYNIIIEKQEEDIIKLKKFIAKNK